MNLPVGWTKWDQLVDASADELSPAKLNEALDKRLAFVTTNLAIIAAVATGFGLFADIGGSLRENRAGLKVVLALLLIAVALSLIASAPNWFKKINVNNLDDVEHYFKSRYEWRAWFARVSILLFTIAVAVTGITVWSVIDESPTPLVSLRYATGKEPTVTATITATSLEPGAEIKSVLLGCPIVEGDADCPDGAPMLAIDHTTADANGKADVALTVTPIPKDVTRVSFVVNSGSGQETRSIDLTS